MQPGGVHTGFPSSLMSRSVFSMERHEVLNHWGFDIRDWYVRGSFFLGSYPGTPLVYLQFESDDGGNTLKGYVRYAGMEDNLSFYGQRIQNSTYRIYENGELMCNWIIGDRHHKPQYPIKMNVLFADWMDGLEGLMTYEGEGPIGFLSQRTGNTLDVQRIRLEQMEALDTELRLLPPTFRGILTELYPRRHFSKPWDR